TGTLMRVEAAWGLGVSVVSGFVTPDRFQIDRDSGQVRDRQAGTKQTQFTRQGSEPVPADRQRALCLTDEQLAQLAELGRKVETVYGDARDIEWAIAGGQIWLLQARPITTAGVDEPERVGLATIKRLATPGELGPTVWSRTNLVEVLPEPTPMTWALVSGKLLSGGGGTGGMYRDFGFKPDPALAARSAYDLIGGRPYLNLAREPRLESARSLAGYPLSTYSANPNLALDPKRENPRGLRKWLGLFGLLRVAAKITAASKSFATEFREKTIPAFATDVERASQEDFSKLDPPALVRRFETWVNRTLVEFAQQSLKPTLLAQFSWQVLEQQIAKSLGAERARAVLTELSQGAKPDTDADLREGIRELAAGTLLRESFLRRFGHRGPNEMELSAPRWAENPSALPTVAASASRSMPAAASDVLSRVEVEAKWNSYLAK